MSYSPFEFECYRRRFAEILNDFLTSRILLKEFQRCVKNISLLKYGIYLESTLRLITTEKYCCKKSISTLLF